MSNIEIKNLIDQDAPGAYLFGDSESFLRDLSENEFDIYGGMNVSTPPFIDTYPSPIYQLVIINMVVNAVLQLALSEH
jgi:hypothetical protein